jgi:hypothetical protein
LGNQCDTPRQDDIDVENATHSSTKVEKGSAGSMEQAARSVQN